MQLDDGQSTNTKPKQHPRLDCEIRLVSARKCNPNVLARSRRLAAVWRLISERGHFTFIDLEGAKTMRKGGGEGLGFVVAN